MIFKKLLVYFVLLYFYYIFLFLVSYSSSASSGLNVTIVTDPPGPVYPAGTWIRFKCILNEVHQEPVLHEW